MELTGNMAIKDQRLEQARVWLRKLDIDVQSDFQQVAGDASFRRYFRLLADGEARILMDAPPPAEDVRPFIDIDRRLRSAGLHAPEIIHMHQQDGYLLLEDLGDELYRGLLDKNNPEVYFPKLFDVLKSMALTVDASNLPRFDAEMLGAEMALFPDWYLARHRSGMIRRKIDTAWQSFCGQIIDSALEQPHCFIHRDFHSCNLLKTSDDDVGIIDFQDAVAGPISYDFISLIWDRYINWPRAQIEYWMEEFRLKLGLEIETTRWSRYCDLMGLQRNIKIVGIFARLHYRDAKSGYIEMIPQFYNYLTDTLRRYPEFAEILDILEQPECVP
jgi:aminoglycoside/choline kinase family phosphotransferase